MRKAIALLLLCLVGASKPQAAKPQKPEPPPLVDPTVTRVVSGSALLEPEGDFFRAVLKNSEEDSCLFVDRVNLRVPHPSRVKELRRYCDFTVKNLHGQRFSLALDKVQDRDITNLSWKGFELSFDMSFLDASPGASELRLRCTLDPRTKQTSFSCDTKD